MEVNFQPGQLVGDYEVLSLLGAGGMGRVYKVRNSVSGRIEALKILLPDLTSSPEHADRFMREIQVHATLDHPNIATLRTALRMENRLLMVMEFVDGASLEALLRQGSIPIWNTVDYLAQVLCALSYAHRKDVTHRDIKPANIIVTPDGVVKLMDFGIARTLDQRKVTQTGVLVGSLYYLSPEQVKSGTIDGRADIYSLGITAYELLTGEKPIGGDSEYAIMHGHLERMPAPPKELRSEIPTALSEAVMKAIAKKPVDRFQTAEEFRSTLETLRRVSGGTTVRVVLPPPVKFGDDLLEEVSKTLSQFIGPIAKTIVRKAIGDHAAWGELLAALSMQIPADADRAVFLRATRKAVGITSSSGTQKSLEVPKPSDSGAGGGVFDAVQLDDIARKYALFVGPLARVLVGRFAKKAKTLDELYEGLAAELDNRKDRDRFLSSRVK